MNIFNFNIRFEVVLTCIVIMIVYLVGILRRKSRGKFPPELIGLPIVGYIPFLTRHPHLKLMELGKKYGEVFSVRFGSIDVVILHSAAATREALSKKEFLGRPPQSAFSLFDNQSPFFMDDMHVWNEQGRFVIQALKHLGLGRSKTEEHIQDEIKHLLQVLRNFNGEPIQVGAFLTPSMSNNICALTFGKRYDYNDPERLLLDDNLEKIIKIIGQTAVHIFFPWIRHIPLVMKWFNFESGVLAYKSTKDLVKKKIQEHKETLDPKNIRDLIDSYLIEMKGRKEKDPNTAFTEDILIGTVLDLFGAGSESVRTSISWCIYTMAAYPQVQRKIQREIFEALGSERSPEFLDQKQMPYTHAVILEILRWKTIVPINALRYTLEDTTVSGYEIPKGTTVTVNFWAVHHDPKLWKDPDSFIPERFLTTDGKSVQKSPNFMLFSLGKRACPGETMAYIEIFLYFVSILQKFDICFPVGVEPTFDAELTVTYRLKPYKIQMLPKQDLNT